MVLLCENYIVQAETHIAIPNERYLLFASMDFLHFFTDYKQDYRLENGIRFNLLACNTFKKKRDFPYTMFIGTRYSSSYSTIRVLLK